MKTETLLEYAALVDERHALENDPPSDAQLDRIHDLNARLNAIEDEALASFTVEDADRLLGLGDQFMEDWEQDDSDGESIERRAEWYLIRPLLVQAPALRKAGLAVIATWEGGDLAGAVRSLNEAVAATRRQA